MNNIFFHKSYCISLDKSLCVCIVGPSALAVVSPAALCIKTKGYPFQNIQSIYIRMYKTGNCAKTIYQLLKPSKNIVLREIVHVPIKKSLEKYNCVPIISRVLTFSESSVYFDEATFVEL